MWFPIIIILGLFTGAVKSTQHASPETKAWHEAQFQKLTANDPEAVAFSMEQNRQEFADMVENGKAIASFNNVPRQTNESLAKMGVIAR